MFFSIELRREKFNPPVKEDEKISNNYIGVTQHPNFEKDPNYLDESKRSEAIKLGAIAAFSPDSKQEIIDLCKGKIAAAIDFVGNEETTSFGVSMIKKGGSVIVVGLYGGSVSLSLPLIPMRSLNLKGSYVGELIELKELVGIIKTGSVKLINVKRQKLDTANDAMNDLKNGKVNGRIVLCP